jgi:hypothetical protein
MLVFLGISLCSKLRKNRYLEFFSTRASIHYAITVVHIALGNFGIHFVPNYEKTAVIEIAFSLF